MSTAKSIHQTPSIRIDNLQYANWSREVFHDMRKGGINAVHATVCYHENFRETVANLTAWQGLFCDHSDLIFHGLTSADIEKARDQGRTAVFFGLQNSSAIENDIGLIKALWDLGIRFMQLTYNNQSLLGCGHNELYDNGLTRMGQLAIQEMNQLGMVIDLSHAAPKTCLQAAQLTTKPLVATHANPYSWHAVSRNLTDDVMRAIIDTGGMIGFSLYPHHIKDGSKCTLDNFCQMVAKTIDIFGIKHFGFGSDLCHNQPDEVVSWMRFGRWTRPDSQERAAAVFPKMPDWFQNNRHWDNIAQGLAKIGFDTNETNLLMGENWLRFYQKAFGK